MRYEVRATTEEAGALLVLAERYGVSVPKLLIDSALAGGSQAAAASASEREAVLRQLLAAQRTLAGVGNNVNQIARRANIDGEIVADLLTTHARARELVGQIAELVTELRVMGR
ncbi:plasmid mobilization relaxosome protein MobC [Litorihabitans aurantiacus]|uniref:plasmid mobilization relaxosome protein MobC n=1 Tax=Litorihabitans aurantiacus TaxID=1930061 RepID=UPI0024E065D6|nr:plasmid mobilization relaxosome protein MobC [Litorihabitans aurantiacus]